MELLMMADAAKRAGVKSIIAIIPYFGFARQDKKDVPRVSITSALIAKMIEASGINHVVTMDLHADQIQGFFNIPISHLYASVAVVPFIRENLFDKDLIVSAPDMGAAKRAKAYSQYLHTDMVICYKYRAEANKIKEMKVIGSVEGKDVLVVDDLIDTAGTLCKCADMLIEKGAKSVMAAVTHPILSGEAYENLANSKLEKLIVTNSIPITSSKFHYDEQYRGHEKIEVVDVAPLFASVIKNIENHTSISANFLL
jgi:ribose-phosphate pyrophosphokinase